MNICSLEMNMFIFCFLLLLPVDAYCPQSSCGTLAIRYPFRLKNRQPRYCGYPGFDLFCTDDNHTLLELPNSVKLYVKTIYYVSQVLNVSDPDDCFLRQALNINISASPFTYKFTFLSDYTLFNCPSANRNVECLTVPGFEVRAVYSDDFIFEYPDMISCTKMYTIKSLPYEYMDQDENGFNMSIVSRRVLQLAWSKPASGLCESHRGIYRYRSKNDSGEGTIECFKKTKGISTSKIFRIAGITLSSILVGVCLTALYRFYSSDRKEKENQARIEKFLEDYETLTPTRFSYADLKRITNQFKDKLGQGAYGTVFKGKVSNEILVAVKILDNSTGNGEEFINEVGTMGRIHHVNAVRLVGFCAEGFHRALVYEFLANESLEKFIFSSNDNSHSLGWGKLQDITIGIAKGIEYLHQGCDQRILHFDIKPHNILLDHNFTPKIADFGLAKLCSKDQSVVSITAARGTMGYIAPEVFSRNFGSVSYKSDVYSFGTLLLEMVGGRKNNTYLNTENGTQVFFSEWIFDNLNRGEELRIAIKEEGDAKIIRKLAIVGLWCIQWFPADRPCMTNVVQMLEGEGDDLAVPPNPFNSAGPRRMDAGRHLHQNLPVISELG